MLCFGSLPIAAETKTRSPQTIGLDTATPSTGVFHATFSPAGTFHFTAVGFPSAVPAALAPRNCGQFCADSDTPAAQQMAIVIKRRMLFPLHASEDDRSRADLECSAGRLVPFEPELRDSRRAAADSQHPK